MSKKFRLEFDKYLYAGVCEVLQRNIKDFESLGYSTDKLKELGRKMGCGV